MIEDELGVRSGVNRLLEPVSDRYLAQYVRTE